MGFLRLKADIGTRYTASRGKVDEPTKDTFCNEGTANSRGVRSRGIRAREGFELARDSSSRGTCAREELALKRTKRVREETPWLGEEKVASCLPFHLPASDAFE